MRINTHTHTQADTLVFRHFIVGDNIYSWNIKRKKNYETNESEFKQKNKENEIPYALPRNEMLHRSKQ